VAFLRKRETATLMFGVAMEQTEGKEKDRQECLSYKLVRADRGLDLGLVNVEVRIDVLHVVVLFQGFD
jgi:hypothetical protein